MKLKLIFPILLFLLIPSLATATPLCEEVVDPSTDCIVVTPVINCTSYTYDLIDGSNHTTLVDDGTMTQIGSTSSYNFTFNRPKGEYLIILCDNSTAQINVKETTETKLDDIESTVEGIEGTVEDIEKDTKKISNIKRLIETVTMGAPIPTLVFGFGMVAALVLVVIVIVLYILSKVRKEGEMAETIEED